MKQAAIGLALLAASCATAPESGTVYKWWDTPALELLAEAARECGFQDTAISYISIPSEDRHMIPAVDIPVLPHDPAFKCTMSWIRSHPETGLRVPE